MSQGIADPTIPHLRVGGPAGEVNANTSAVLKLQRQVIVRPALHGDVVLAGLDAHGISLGGHGIAAARSLISVVVSAARICSRMLVMVSLLQWR